MPRKKQGIVGKVKKYNEQKGYGFLKTEAVSDDVFIHISDVEDLDGLTTNHYLQFDAVHEEKGWRAENATKVRGTKGVEGIVRSYDPATRTGILRGRGKYRDDIQVDIDDVIGASDLKFGWSVEFDVRDGTQATNVVVTDRQQFESQPNSTDEFSKSESATITGTSKQSPTDVDETKVNPTAMNTADDAKTGDDNQKGGYKWKGNRVVRRKDGK